MAALNDLPEIPSTPGPVSGNSAPEPQPDPEPESEASAEPQLEAELEALGRSLEELEQLDEPEPEPETNAGQPEEQEEHAADCDVTVGTVATDSTLNHTFRTCVDESWMSELPSVRSSSQAESETSIDDTFATAAASELSTSRALSSTGERDNSAGKEDTDSGYASAIDASAEKDQEEGQDGGYLPFSYLQASPTDESGSSQDGEELQQPNGPGTVEPDTSSLLEFSDESGERRRLSSLLATAKKMVVPEPEPEPEPEPQQETDAKLTLDVMCPDGTQPGQLLRVRVPGSELGGGADEGAGSDGPSRTGSLEIEVEVPPGVHPGDTFLVEVAADEIHAQPDSEAAKDQSDLRNLSEMSAVLPSEGEEDSSRYSLTSPPPLSVCGSEDSLAAVAEADTLRSEIRSMQQELAHGIDLDTSLRSPPDSASAQPEYERSVAGMHTVYEWAEGDTDGLDVEAARASGVVIVSGVPRRGRLDTIVSASSQEVSTRSVGSAASNGSMTAARTASLASFAEAEEEAEENQTREKFVVAEDAQTPAKESERKERAQAERKQARWQGGSRRKPAAAHSRLSREELLRRVTARFGPRVAALLAKSPQHELEVFLEGVDLTEGFSPFKQEAV